MGKAPAGLWACLLVFACLATGLAMEAAQPILPGFAQNALPAASAKTQLVSERIKAGQYRQALENLGASSQILRRRLEGVARICPQAPAQSKAWRVAMLGLSGFLNVPQDLRLAHDSLRYAGELDPNEPRFQDFLRLLLAEYPALAQDQLPPGMRLLQYKRFVALNFMFEGEYQLAVDALNQILALEPDDLVSLKRLGSTYYMWGYQGKAMETWARALSLAPRDPHLREFVSYAQSSHKEVPRLEQKLKERYVSP